MPSGNAWQWIVDGFRLFQRNPWIWMLTWIVVAVIIYIVSRIPGVGSLALTLLLPVLAGGLMLGCDAQMRGEPLEIAHLFAGFRSKTSSLVLVGLLSLVGSILIGLVAGILIGFSVFAALLSGGGIGAMGASAVTVLLGLLVALGLSILLTMAIWFAPALVVFHDLQPMDAMKQSFQGCLRNIVLFLIYGIIIVTIGVLALIPAGLGWLIWGPTLVASIYTSYRDIFIRPA